MKTKLAVVVIPVYKATLTRNERASLQQCCKVLGRHDLCFVAPEGLQLPAEEARGVRYEYFAPEYFRDRAGYSRLLLSPLFYERFAAYEFLLIYQLDAFVFSDRLAEFCQLGYDDIGAPMGRWLPHWHEIGARAGNGGFSLRRVQACLAVTRDKERILADHLSRAAMEDFEDIFFAYCGTRADVSFRVTPVHVAKTFALERDVGHAYRQVPDVLPFGCHAWSRHRFDIWQPVLAREGYTDVEPDYVHAGFDERRAAMDWYLVRRLARPGNAARAARARTALFGASPRVSLWGYGYYGKRLLPLLLAMGYDVVAVYDKKLEGEAVSGVPIRFPSEAELRAHPSLVIVTTNRYGREVAAELAAMGFRAGVDDLMLFDFCHKLVQAGR